MIHYFTTSDLDIKKLQNKMNLPHTLNLIAKK